jgi:hypothetical protein
LIFGAEVVIYKYMYIEKYNVYVANNTTKKVKKVLIEANTPQEAHKKAYVNTHMFTDDITKITDFTNNVVYTHKDGFIAK